MGRFVEKKTVIMKQKISYKDAGVDIEKTDKAIASSKKTIQSTFTKNVLSSVGGFGSMYSLKDVLKNYDDPIIVQSIDGCLLYTSPSPRDLSTSRMPSSA